MKPAGLELHIGELVLEGFAAGDRQAIGAAVERELARLFEVRGIPPALSEGGEMPRIDGGRFTVARGSRPDAVGAQVAHAVYEQLGTRREGNGE